MATKPRRNVIENGIGNGHIERQPLQQFSIADEDSDEDIERKASQPLPPPPPIFRHVRDTHPPPTYTHILINRLLLRYFPRLVLILTVSIFMIALLPGGWRVALCSANLLPPPALTLADENITIIGHRGVEFPYPENSIQALQEAVKVTDFVEFDVALTSDHAVILLHDIAYDNLTIHGTGLTCMSSLDYAESLVLKTPERDPQGKISNGKFCTRDRANGGVGTVPCTYRIPTLSSVFETLPDTTKFMIDIKACYATGIKVSASLCSNCTILMDQIVELMVKHFINPKRVVFTSTQVESLRVFQDGMAAKGKNTSFALSMDPTYSHYKQSTVINLLDDEHYDAVSMHFGLAAVRPDLVHAIRNSRKPWSMENKRDLYVWTIRRDMDYKLARCAGASTFIAAQPGRLKRTISRDESASLLEET